MKLGGRQWSKGIANVSARVDIPKAEIEGIVAAHEVILKQIERDVQVWKDCTDDLHDEIRAAHTEMQVLKSRIKTLEAKGAKPKRRRSSR